MEVFATTEAKMTALRSEQEEEHSGSRIPRKKAAGLKAALVSAW